MVDFTLMIAYVLLIGIPSLILGFGAMVGESTGTKLLALINFLSILTYYTYRDIIPGWIAGLFMVFLSLIFVFLFKSVLGESA